MTEIISKQDARALGKWAFDPIEFAQREGRLL
jgi:hypothetical protein